MLNTESQYLFCYRTSAKIDTVEITSSSHCTSTEIATAELFPVIAETTR